MPVTIPTPLGAAPRKRPNPIETLLLGLVGQAGSLGLQRLIAPGIAGARQEAIEAKKVETAKTVAELEAETQAAIEVKETEAYNAARLALGKVPSVEVEGVTVNRAAALQNALDVSFTLSRSGQGDSVINTIVKEALPPDSQDLLAEQEARIRIITAKSDQEANEFATQRLIEMGVLPDGAPVFPGASKALLALIESKEGKKINFFQEGLDFIIGRVGDSISGSSIIMVGGLAQANPFAGQESVSVDQAVAEWRNLLERFAPENVVEREFKRLDSAAARREITKGIAVETIVELIEAGGTDADIFSAFAGAFTKVETRVLINRAKRRIEFPR